MPIQRDTQIEGTFNGQICYKSRGKYLVRAKGNTGRQAMEAKIQAGILGKASAISARLRKSFASLLPDPGNRQLMYKLNRVLQHWLRTNPIENTARLNEISFLNGFTFNEANPLGAMFYTTMPVYRSEDGQLRLQIPAFDSPNPVAPLPFSGYKHIRVNVASCNLSNTDDVQQYATELRIDYNGTPVPAQLIELPLQTKQGYLTVVAVSVNDMAAGITGSLWN